VPEAQAALPLRYVRLFPNSERIAWEFGAAPARLMGSALVIHPNFSVVVKNRASAPKPWSWEIFRAGRTSPIRRSDAFFTTMAEASRAGDLALSLLLSEYPDC
jgi:hypothetical protein